MFAEEENMVYYKVCIVQSERSPSFHGSWNGKKMSPSTIHQTRSLFFVAFFSILFSVRIPTTLRLRRRSRSHLRIFFRATDAAAALWLGSSRGGQSFPFLSILLSGFAQKRDLGWPRCISPSADGVSSIAPDRIYPESGKQTLSIRDVRWGSRLYGIQKTGKIRWSSTVDMSLAHQGTLFPLLREFHLNLWNTDRVTSHCLIRSSIVSYL